MRLRRTRAKSARGEAVGAGILERICASMQCSIGDIVDYVPEASVKCKMSDAEEAWR